MNASEYLQLGRVLRVPEELVRYFDHREEAISGFGPDAESLPEAAIVGQFISGEIGIAPTLASAEPLRHLVDDSEQWDLTPFLRGLHNSLSENQDSKQYYSILLEFAKLPRSMWRAAKDRLLLSIKKADEGKFTLPYRFCEPNTLSGFVFIPVDSETSARPDWKKVRIDGLKNMTLGHKYDQRLETCVGCQIAKDGNYFDIQWCYVSFPWEEDHLLADALKENFPFRPVKSAVVSGYKFFADTDGAGSSPAD